MDCAVLAQPYNHVSFKRRKNTWYTIASGNWSDPNIWMSNSHRRWSSPQTGDDVNIGLGHTVTFDVAGGVITTINNFSIAGAFLLNNNTTRTLNILGDLQVVGSLDLTSTVAFTLALFGVNNYINTFNSGNNSTVSYSRQGDQYIMNLSYRNLSFSNGSVLQSGSGSLLGLPAATKYLTSDLNISGNVSIGGITVPILELGSYNLTVNGTLSNNNISSTVYSTIKKSGSGSVLVLGLFTNNGLLDFSGGNPTVELRGGFTMNNNAFSSGTGNWNFTTNSQTITLGTGTYSWNGNANIVGAIAVTETGTGIMNMNAPIDCTSSSGSVVAKGTIYFNSTSSLPSFTTGTFDRTTNANTVGYTMGASITLPYTSYYSLVVGGTGIKTPSTTLSLPGSLTINSGGSLQMAGFDLTVTGAMVNSGTLSKSASGAILFIGAATFSASSTIDLTGSPSVEVRGGLSIGSGITYNGAVTLNLTTNNQSLNPIGTTGTLAYSVLISGAITVTSTATNLSLIVTGTINGNNAASTLDNRITGTGSLQYQNTQQPMLTGVLQTNLAANTFIYNKAGDQNITGGTYKTLTLAGSGIKTLQGNVVVATLYTLTPPATLNTNGFTRT